MQILITDLDPQHRDTLVKLVKEWQHLPVDALTIDEVLTICKRKCPDLVLVDQQLTNVSGIDIIKAIRKLGATALWNPLYIMGDNFTDEYMQQAIDAGVDGFLTKPIHPLQLKAKIAAAARHQDLKEQVFSAAHDLVITNRALEVMVSEDELTGVANINTFEDNLEAEWFKAKRDGTDLGMVTLDLDYFQKFNQLYNVEKGDEALQKVALAMQQALPQYKKYISRTKGASFTVLLPEANKAMVMRVAEQLHSAIGLLKIEHQGSGCGVYLTASFGAAVTDKTNMKNPWDLLESADYALYKAKHSGRDQIYFVLAEKQ